MDSATTPNLWSAVTTTLALLGPPLLLTLGIELPVAALMGLRSRRALSAVALVSLVTNPALNLALVVCGAWGLSPGSPWVFWSAVVALELLVVLAEWRLLLWALGGSPRRMLLVSAVMNAASLGAGLAYSWIPGLAFG